MGYCNDTYCMSFDQIKKKQHKIVHDCLLTLDYVLERAV